jgi:hypothetical protein
MPGYAMKATGAGFVIGQALSEYTDSAPGKVMVFIRGQYWSGPEVSSVIQNGGDASLASLNVTGTTNLNDLNVSGVANFANLTVTGTATVGTLVVTGPASVGTLTVNGHIITAGSTPTISEDVSCGTGCTATITGTDTAGTITVHTGSDVNAGSLATVTFADAYTGTPNIVITPKNVPDSASYPEFYYDSSSPDANFQLKTHNTLTPNQTYIFSYHIIQ